MKIKWPSMASTASMRSSGVAGFASSISVLALFGCSDIGALADIVAKGAGWLVFASRSAVGCVLMAAFV